MEQPGLVSNGATQTGKQWSNPDGKQWGNPDGKQWGLPYCKMGLALL